SQPTPVPPKVISGSTTVHGPEPPKAIEVKPRPAPTATTTSNPLDKSQPPTHDESQQRESDPNTTNTDTSTDVAQPPSNVPSFPNPESACAPESFLKSKSSASTPRADLSVKNRPACIRSAPARVDLPSNAESHTTADAPSSQIAVAADGDSDADGDYEVEKSGRVVNPFVEESGTDGGKRSDPARIDLAVNTNNNTGDGPLPHIAPAADADGDRENEVQNERVVEPFVIEKRPPKSTRDGCIKEVVDRVFGGLKGFIRIIVVPGEITITPVSSFGSDIEYIRHRPNRYRALYKTSADAQDACMTLEPMMEKARWYRFGDEKRGRVRSHWARVRVESVDVDGSSRERECGGTGDLEQGFVKDLMVPVYAVSPPRPWEFGEGGTSNKKTEA
ncbi:hypothetical protein HK102_010633, partial [Quaeritorhiza haematococci]